MHAATSPDSTACPYPPPAEKLEQVESQLQHGGRMARFAASSDSKKKDGEGALSRVCRWVGGSPLPG
jgi:hypothetical protein